MAVGIRIMLAGVDAETYDRAHDQINPDRSTPSGLIFHTSGPVDGGWGIIDVWESRADFDAFAVRIQAGVEAAGVEMAGPPQIDEFAVHEYISA